MALRFTSSNNTIGGLSADDRNVVAGNVANGIELNGTSGVSNNLVAGNYVGVGADGVTALANGNNGVLLVTAISPGPGRVGGAGNGASIDNVIGPGNVISGNARNGVCFCPASQNVIIGNRIGTDAAGSSAIPNGDGGVAVVEASDGNQIGGTTPQARNVISGNSESGIRLSKGGGTVANNRIQGNYIGTNAAGIAGLGNGGIGVSERNADDTIIGGAAPGAGNVISGNGQEGVNSVDSVGTVIQGNYFGTDAAGTNAVPNIDRHIYLLGGQEITVGGESAGARNVISGGDADGIYVGSTAVSNSSTTTSGWVPMPRRRWGTSATASTSSGQGTAASAYVRTPSWTTGQPESDCTLRTGPRSWATSWE